MDLKAALKMVSILFYRRGIFKDHFEFGPNFGVNELKNEPEVQRYKYHIPVDEMAVDCFILGNGSKCTPTFLEDLFYKIIFFKKKHYQWQITFFNVEIFD